MNKTFLVAAGISASLFIVVFVATMYEQYQGINYSYLAYGLGVIIAISLVISLLSSKLSKGKVLVSAALSAVASLGVVGALAFL